MTLTAMSRVASSIHNVATKVRTNGTGMLTTGKRDVKQRELLQWSENSPFDLCATLYPVRAPASCQCVCSVPLAADYTAATICLMPNRTSGAIHFRRASHGQHKALVALFS